MPDARASFAMIRRPYTDSAMAGRSLSKAHIRRGPVIITTPRHMVKTAERRGSMTATARSRPPAAARDGTSMRQR